MKPWEKYAAQTTVEEKKPWEKYAQSPAEAAPTSEAMETGGFEASVGVQQPDIPTSTYEMQKALIPTTEDITEEAKGIAERTKQRVERFQEPTILGKMAEKKFGTGFIGTGIKHIAEKPEQKLRAAGAIAGTIGELFGIPMSLGMKAQNRLTGGMVDKLIGDIGEKAAENETVQGLISWWKGLSKEKKANIASAVDLTEAIGWGSGKATEKVLKQTGEKVVDVGTDFLGADLKIKDSLAKRGYGSAKRIDLKKRKILDDISKYELDDVMGNFEKMATKADDLAVDRVKKADEILSGIAASPDAPKGQFVDDIVQDAYENVGDFADLGDRKNVTNVLDNILDEAAGEGLASTAEKGLDELIEFKRRLNKRGKLFVEGPSESEADNLKRAIKKRLYKDAVVKIREISPEAADLNKQAKELWDIEAVASSAVSRKTNLNRISLGTKIIGGGTYGAYIMSQAMNNPEAAMRALMAGAALYTIPIVAGQGRGASAIIGAGKKVKRTGDILGKLEQPISAGVSGGISIGTRGASEEER